MILKQLPFIQEWNEVADRIEQLSRQQHCYGQYRQLCSDIRGHRIDAQVSDRTAAAIATLEGDPQIVADE